jgi:hypothetical protein
MTIESDVYQALAAVTAAYPVSLPANPTLPSASYRFISETQMHSHSGESLTKRRLQVDCWAHTYVASTTLADSVKSALDLKKTTFKLITAENAVDLSDPTVGIYHRALEFYVWE